ncbi:ATP-dependent exoDNAse beta subunit [Aromatoleum aromaticum EbN1]|uniref:RecBCD enzyme subunit RecB n=1 Tax=Aromatoleum aromaticum (strain DSM 19018 / LMG 30748 / EbN1) TaxID=76114 RepID=Q5P4V8_AROAE|nr:exodeoxyribonuclease V subunit beta [Aromatoleum aromaticum]CAI07654.1 ATP-dependent exoDNAse beta subunit [Aromatoleum aromaticum EbN1]
MTTPAPGPGAADELDVFGCPLDGIRLIEASAGTGKTWNICGLFLRLLVERELAVDAILVVTFTRAATAELKSRVRERIAGTLAYLDGTAADGDPFVAQLVAALESQAIARAQIRERLDLALQTFDEAAIFTIHGYCQRALADTPFAAALPFALELTEDDLELRLEAARDFWRREIASDACAAELGELLIARGDSPERWATLLGRYLARPLAQKRWPDAGGEVKPDLAAVQAAFADACALWHGNGRDARDALLAGLPGLSATSYKADSVALAAKSWTSWLAGGDPLAPLDVQGGKFALFSAMRLNECVKKHCSAPQHPFFDAAARVLALRDEVIAALDAARLALLRRFLETGSTRLRETKRERRRIAFDDILFNVHEALAGADNPWLAAALHQRYPVALIDEFQDTDPLQFEIFRSIYATGGRHGGLFLVGDPKQAIYSFRNADLHTYLHARSEADTRYTLSHNQRSVGGLIDACNALFTANPAAFVLDGLAYETVSEGAKPRQRFVDSSAAADPASLRVWWIAPDADGVLPLRAAVVARAAAATAAEIVRLVGEGAAGHITIGPRALAPGDIAVLVKSHSQGARMREALAALGVGSVELSQQSVFHSPDAEELERVLVAIAEPAHLPLLSAALATAPMGFDAAALDALAADEAELLRVIARFTELREVWLARGLGVMLRRWIVQEGINARLLARDDGERRLTNLLHLAECLHEAAADHPSPDALLRWFATRRREAGASEATQVRLESDRNLVQIVTIHRSKGLEYGVVFCPFLWDGFPGRGDDGEGCVYHDADGGLLLDFRPSARDDDDVKAVMRRERDAEFLRLIYVAMTRAVYRCYLVAGCYLKKNGKTASPTESTRSLLNWLVAGAGTSHAEWLRHKLTTDDIEAAWARLLERAEPDLAIVNLPAGGSARLASAEPAADALHVLPPPVRLPSAWRIGSFSALSHGAGHEAAAQDHDARALLVAPIDGATSIAPAAAPGDDDILFFPRGPTAGDCIHAVFERLDFPASASRTPAIAAALTEHPQRAPGGAPLARMLERLVEDVLATPLPGGIVLGRLDCRRKLVELGFHLPAPRLSAEALNDWLARAGYHVPRLAFGALAGYLKGFIDLVFEHDGRFYVLDWKSNHLGFTPEDYAPARLEEAMRAHGYHLQHLLYAVALHRHLGRTLPGYDFERHFGGALYLFVRGVRPGWRLGEHPAGVYFHRPDAATLASLDRLIGGVPAPESVR